MNKFARTVWSAKPFFNQHQIPFTDVYFPYSININSVDASKSQSMSVKPKIQTKSLSVQYEKSISNSISSSPNNALTKEWMALSSGKMNFIFYIGINSQFSFFFLSVFNSQID